VGKSLKNSLAIFFISVALSTHAFQPEYERQDWEEERNRYQLTEGEKNESAIVLKHLIVDEYVYTEDNQGLEIYSTEHRIIRVNNDDAIQAYNKVYISMENVIDIVNVKVRSLNINGEMIELSQSEIREIEDKEGRGLYKILAVEGVEIGSEIEYIYTKRKGISYFGREYVQSKVPVKDMTFKLIVPENLRFSLKTYNGIGEVSKTLNGDKIYWILREEHIPALVEEPFSYYNANRARIEYKLSYNKYGDGERLLTWTDAARRIHSNIYQLTKEESKRAEKFYKSLKIPKSFSEEDKIRTIENHIKEKISLQENYNPQYSELIYIIENKIGNILGLVKLFATLFEQANIQHEIVLTSDRSNIRFDKDFDSWNYLVNYLIFFPKSDKYLTPEKFEFRYGMVPYHLTSTYGLFINSISFGAVEMGLGQIRFIPPLAYDQNYDDLFVNIEFGERMESLSMEIDRMLGGYSAVFIQPYYRFLPDERKREVIENYIRLSASDADFIDLEVNNTEPDISPIDAPFIIKSKVKSSALLERAGPKYLFKIGEVIGPQRELYQDDERRNPVENDFNRMYDRRISFPIPENYRIKNLDDININVYHEQNGDKVFLFRSKYVVEGNVVKVQIDEYYKVIYCETEEFEAFRKVINAAADFNKVTLVLEKIQG